jgi:ABC-type maltose transport system permease subunit
MGHIVFLKFLQNPANLPLTLDIIQVIMNSTAKQSAAYTAAAVLKGSGNTDQILGGIHNGKDFL